jgi:hypothetical protein
MTEATTVTRWDSCFEGNNDVGGDNGPGIWDQHCLLRAHYTTYLRKKFRASCRSGQCVISTYIHTRVTNNITYTYACLARALLYDLGGDRRWFCGLV